MGGSDFQRDDEELVDDILSEYSTSDNFSIRSSEFQCAIVQQQQQARQQTQHLMKAVRMAGSINRS